MRIFCFSWPGLKGPIGLLTACAGLSRLFWGLSFLDMSPSAPEALSVRATDPKGPLLKPLKSTSTRHCATVRQVAVGSCRPVPFTSPKVPCEGSPPASPPAFGRSRKKGSLSDIFRFLEGHCGKLRNADWASSTWHVGSRGSEGRNGRRAESPTDGRDGRGGRALTAMPRSPKAPNAPGEFRNCALWCSMVPYGALWCPMQRPLW